MKKTVNTHPFLYYSADDLKKAKSLIESNADAAARFEKLKAKGDETLSKELLTEEFADSVYSQHGKYYEVAALLEEVANVFPLLSYMTGDDKYFEHAKKMLLYYADFKVWTGPANANRRTPWHSELATTRMLCTFCVLYDFYYDRFTEEERNIITDAIISKGIDPLYADWVDPERRVHALDSMGHNWWSVCIAFCGIGIITLFDILPDAERKLSLVIKALEGFCNYKGHTLLNKIPNFDGKGMFYESAGYFSYGVGELLNFIFVYTRAFDDKEIVRFPVLEKTGDAILSMTYLTSNSENPVMLVNYGDSATKGSGIALLCKMLLLCGYGDDRHVYCYNSCTEFNTAIDFIYADILHKKADASCFEKMALSDIYPETGYGFWRSSWQKDATLFGMRCGYTWNHAHDDAGSFILWDKGKQLLIDSGSTSYSSPDYNTYFTACKSHNMVTVNDQNALNANIRRGTKFRGTIPEHHDGDWMRYLLCDATGPVADRMLRNYRSFIQLDDGLYVIIDDLLSVEPANYQWLLHYYGNSEINDGVIRISNDSSFVNVYPVTPDCELIERTSPVGGEYSTLAKQSDEKIAYLCRETTEKSQDNNFIHVLSLNCDIDVKSLSGDSWRGAEIKKGDTVYRVFYNMEADGRKMHENSNNRLDMYDTDGYILVERTENGEKCLFMAYGSYLRTDDEVIYDSFTKDFVFI